MRYKKGEENIVADFLSRIEEEDKVEKDYLDEIIAVIADTPTE